MGSSLLPRPEKHGRQLLLLEQEKPLWNEEGDQELLLSSGL